MAQYQQALRDLDVLQNDMNVWFQRTTKDLANTYNALSTRLRVLEENTAAMHGVPAAADSVSVGGSFMTSQMETTPVRPHMHASLDDTPGMASPPVSHALNYDALIDEVEREAPTHVAAPASKNASAAGINAAAVPFELSATQSPSSIGATPHKDRPLRDTPEAERPHARPTPDSLPPEVLNVPRPLNKSQPCHVLVEFKRQRVLQFESDHYVAAGEYVVVAGDRGEDVGLVTYTWVSGAAGPPTHIGKYQGVGVGKVARVATALEVSQLQGVQAELEVRAREVAQQKVVEHQLPMRIVDAEYQFDRKKLTFYYQSQHRLDFRVLVRDLYKTFRARIWMELD